MVKLLKPNYHLNLADMHLKVTLGYMPFINSIVKGPSMIAVETLNWVISMSNAIGLRYVIHHHYGVHGRTK